MSHFPRNRCYAAALCFLVGISLTLSAIALADEPAAEIDSQVEQIVRRVATHLADTRALSVDVTTNTTMDGFGIKMETTQEIRIERPNKLAIVTKASQGGFGSGMSPDIVSDGDNLYISIPMMKRYMVSPAEKSLDAMSNLPFVSGPGGGGLLSLLMSDKPYEDLMHGVRSATYIGKADLDGKKCHHLKFIQDDMNWEIWIDAGEIPLVRQVVPDIAKTMQQAGEQFGAGDVFGKLQVKTVTRFANWNVDPTFVDADFKFEPPPGSVRVDSMLEGLLDLGLNVTGEQTDEEVHPLVGKPAPTCKLACLGKDTVDLADHKEKHAIVLEFWATWSEPCVKALPIVADVAKDYMEKGVVFYAVNVEEDNESIHEYLSEQRLGIDVLLDKNGAVSDRFQADEIPQLVLIDKQGLVQAVHVGVIPNLSSQLHRDLDAMLTNYTATKAAGKDDEEAASGP